MSAVPGNKLERGPGRGVSSLSGNSVLSVGGARLLLVLQNVGESDTLECVCGAILLDVAELAEGVGVCGDSSLVFVEAVKAVRSCSARV
jgi:hypothetical protein